MKPPILPFCLAALVLASCAADDPRAEGLNVRAPYGSVAGQGDVASWSPGSSYSNMGRQSLAQGQPERAAYQFEEALKVNPFDPVAHGDGIFLQCLGLSGPLGAARGLDDAAAPYTQLLPRLAPGPISASAWIAVWQGYSDDQDGRDVLIKQASCSS